MEKKKLAFVDYWTHQNTKSGDFLREILSEKFTIYDFWWKEKKFGSFSFPKRRKWQNTLARARAAYRFFYNNTTPPFTR